jgi:predicted tellurium resistance membrane protein TerC
MERFPVLITLGAALLGYVAGEMAVGDIAVKDYVEAHAHLLDTLAPLIGALFVVGVGKMIQRTRAAEADARTAEVAAAPIRGEGALRVETTQ